MGDLLVGREVESLALDAALADVTHETRGVLVSGEAGIGKSALVRAFLDRARDGEAMTLVGSGLPDAGVELPYAPVAQMLRQARREYPDELNAALGPQAAAVIAPLLPDVYEPANEMSLPPGPPGLERSRLLSAMVGVFESLTRRNKVVLLVEDLHWVDSSTLSLLGLMLRGTPETDLLIVATVREVGQATRVRRWCATERAAGGLTVLPLPPLSLDETARLLAMLGPDTPTASQAADVQRLSGGNPFLVRELARVRPGEMPSAVREIVQAELEVLPPAAREVVAAAAVAGRPIEHVLLAEVVGEKVAAGAVAAAVHAGLLRVEAGSYSLGHELTRTAVTEVLLPAERLRLHAELAHALAGRIGMHEDARDLGEIAWHFEQAGAVANTVAWALRAAAASERVGAFSSAQLQFERALAVADSPPVAMPDDERVALLRRAAAAADYAGEVNASLSHLDAALGLVDPASDAELAAALQAHRCWLFIVLDDVPKASAAAELAMTLLPADADPASRAEVAIRTALVLGSMGQLADAHRRAELGLAAALETRDEALIGRAMRELASWIPLAKVDQESTGLLEGARERAAAVGDPEDIAGAAIILSDRLCRTGRHEDAAQVALDAHEALAKVAEGVHWMDSILISNACEALMALGRWDEAARLLDVACATDSFGTVRLQRAALRIARGSLELAERDLVENQHLQRHDQPYFGLEYDEILAELRLWQHRPGEALDVVCTVLDKLDDDAMHELAPQLVVLGLRAAADLAADARIYGDARQIDEAHAQGLRLAAVAASILTEQADLRAAAEGELGRLDQVSNPQAWAAAAACAQMRNQPQRQAYALWRQAEALLEGRTGRAAAGAALQEAANIAGALGAAVLTVEIEALSRRARLPLEAAAPPIPERRHPSAARILSAREAAVLELVVQGRTNREIGDILYISPKTVSVHVTHLMQKLGVRSRVQAAAVAHRFGIGDNSVVVEDPSQR